MSTGTANPQPRIRDLRELLITPEPATTAGPIASVPDPAVELEAARRRALEQAQQAGYAAGMQRAEAEIAKAKTRARHEIEEAQAQALADVREQADRLRMLTTTVAEAAARADAGVEAVAVSVAMAAVTRVLGVRHADRTLVPALCEQALAEFRQRPVVVRLCPADAAAMDALLPESEDLRIEADGLLRPGECRLETLRGMYDTSVATRLQAITDALVRELEAAP